MKARAWIGLLFFALLAGVPWGRYFSANVDLTQMNAASSWTHPLGTDNLGRDLLVRLSEAVKGAILPLWCVTLLASAIGTWGGYWVCRWMGAAKNEHWPMFIVSCCSLVAAVPIGLIVFFVAALIGSTGLFPVLIALASLVLVRSGGLVLELYGRDNKLGYWQAHAASGGSLASRLWTYGLLGGWRKAILDSLCLHLRVGVTIEASLSYLGFGIAEPQASLGNILASHFDSSLKGSWWIPCITVVVLGFTAKVPSMVTKVSPVL